MLKGSNYDVALLKAELVQQFEDSIIIKETKSGNGSYVECTGRGKDIKQTLEDVILQLY